jgi:N utilization substance protein B
MYAWDLRPGQRLVQVAERVWDDLAIGPNERKFAAKLIRTVADSQADIDKQLLDVTTNWRLERLGAIERSVLRLGAAEFAGGETPPKVVIKEAVRLAERYGSEDSAKFVNGVLDAYARRVGLI